MWLISWQSRFVSFRRLTQSLWKSLDEAARIVRLFTWCPRVYARIGTTHHHQSHTHKFIQPGCQSAPFDMFATLIVYSGRFIVCRMPNIDWATPIDNRAHRAELAHSNNVLRFSTMGDFSFRFSASKSIRPILGISNMQIMFTVCRTVLCQSGSTWTRWRYFDLRGDRKLPVTNLIVALVRPVIHPFIIELRDCC